MTYRPSRRLVISTGIIFCLLGALITALPEIVRRVAVNRLGNYFTVPVSIEDIDLNLFTGRGVIESLVIGGNQTPPVLSLPAATIEFSRAALLKGQIVFSDIVAKQPELVIERLGPDSYNVVEAMSIPDTSSQDRGNAGLGFSIRHLGIQNGHIVFIDRTQEPDYKVALSSLNFAAGPISTVPEDQDTPTTFRAGVNIGDGSVTLTGSTKDLGKPVTAELKADISNVELQRFDVYLPYGERLSLKNSLLNGQAHYVNTADREKTSEHYLKADLEIGGAALMAAPGLRSIFEVSGLAARNIHFDLLKNSTVIGTAVFQNPYLLIERDSAGFNFQQLVPANESAVSSNGSADGGSMSLAIERVEAENGAVQFMDKAVDPNVNSHFQDFQLVAENVQVLPHFAAGQIQGKARLDNGTLNLTGSLSGQSSAGRLVLAGEKLPFHPFRGYLDQIFQSAKSSGERIDGELQLTLKPDNDRQPHLEISGGLQGHDMALRFADQQDPFLTTERLGVEISEISFGSNPSVDIDRIGFTGANLSIVRRQDGNLNLTRLWSADEHKTSEAKKDETESSDEEGEGTTVAIRVISVDKSNISIVDRTVSPNYDTKLSGVSGTVTGIRPQRERAQLKVAGKLGDSADLSLSGWFTPFSKETDLQLQGTVRSYALPPLNPYATEYVSHRIQRGQVTMDVKYTMTEGKIKAVADVVLRNVRVGEKTGDEFVDRIGIPLELAVALLEDINGVIDLQFTVTGESGFKLNLASLIWEAARNAILRAITAPFRLVGNILTLGGRIGQVRIDPIPFEPGTREIPSTAAERISKLAELLSNKPRIDLKIVGGVSRGEADALRQKKFWEMLASTNIEDYQEALIALYHKLGGVTKPEAPLDRRTEESLERFVKERLEIADQDLRELGRDRAEIVKEQLVEHGVDPERLSVAAPENIARDGEPAVEIQLAS